MATPLEEISHSTDQEDHANQEKQMKRQKKKLEKEMNALETALEKQEGRLSNLQSSAFQLASYHLVFQVLVLAVLCNGSTALRCSDRWLLATLSALVAALNLAALVSIGSKYNRMVIQQARTWVRRNELHGKLSNLEEQENQQHRLPSRNLSGNSSGGSLDAANSAQGSNDNGILDQFGILKRRVYFSVFVLFFVAFTIVVFVGCLKIPCRD